MKISEKLKSSGYFKSRSNIPVEDLDPVACQNCAYEFKGHFCPNCGQEVAEFNRPFGFVLYDFLGNFFAFDTRFFQSFKYLLIRPGFLTVEFFKGRRARHSPPFRIFVFLSFFLFLLLQINTERALDKASVTSATVKEESASSDLSLSAEFGTSLDSVTSPKPELIEKAGAASDSVDNMIPKDHESVYINWKLFGSGNMRENLNKQADSFEEQLRQTTNPVKKKKLISYIGMCRVPEMAISNVLRYLSWAFLLLLPVFALLLKLFYIRRNQFYIRHLIFSIHLHSYLFFILIIISILNLIFDSGIATLSSVLLATFPVYLIVAMYKFYGQSIVKVFAKFLLISMVYNMVLLAVFAYVFVKSFGLT